MRQFIVRNREKFNCSSNAVRTVCISEFIRSKENYKLERYIADKAPLFYRETKNIIQDIEDGFYLTSIIDTLSKLPTSDSFKESHFGEITAGIFAEDVLGLKRLYSKLSLLSAENSNAYKMDLVLYNPRVNPVEFIWGEVKCSHKTRLNGAPPAGHDKTCYASIFNSLNKYESPDLNFDLVAVKDNISSLPEDEQNRIREALKPYTERKIRYIGIAVIDSSTRDDDEISVLATRRNNKELDVDLICIEQFPLVAEATYNILDGIRKSCSG